MKHDCIQIARGAQKEKINIVLLDCSDGNPTVIHMQIYIDEARDGK